MAKKKATSRKKAATKGRAKKKPASRKKKAPAMESILVASKAKAALKAHGVNVAGDALDGLNGMLHWYIDQAAKRALANNRKTVRAHDFVLP